MSLKPKAVGSDTYRQPVRYLAALSTLIVPAIVAYFLLGKRPLNPLVSLTFILAIVASGWIAGTIAAVVVALLEIPVVALIATSGKMIVPDHLDWPATVTLLIIAALSGSFARARRRVEQLLQQSNRELEERVKERTSALEEAKSWLETTLSSIGDAVIATDRSGAVVFMNAVAAQLTGWSESEAKGRAIGEVFEIVNEETREAAVDPVERVLRTGQIAGLANHTVLISRSRAEFAIDDAAAPIRDGEGNTLGVVLTFRDISEKRQAAKDAERARVNLEQTNAELEQFAYAAAHDLREPLRAVSIYSQLLQKEYAGRLDGKADEFISVICDGVRRMETLLEGLLAYTRIIEGSVERQHSAEGQSALDGALAALSTAIQECGATVTSDPLPQLEMDPVHLEQLFQNLIGNALKYRSQRTPSIHIGAVREEKGWVVTVSDNGIGIEPQYHQRIFGLFKRLHSSPKYEGTGIGLALCQKIVNRYGGRIWVKSDAGAGSVFHFFIPDNGAMARTAAMRA